MGFIILITVKVPSQCYEWITLQLNLNFFFDISFHILSLTLYWYLLRKQQNFSIWLSLYLGKCYVFLSVFCSFKLMVTATADNCLLTCYPFLALHRTDYQIVCEQVNNQSIESIQCNYPVWHNQNMEVGIMTHTIK